MNIISVIYLLCAFICFESAFYILNRNRRAPANILFAAAAFNYTLFCICFSQFVNSPTKEGAVFWHYLSIPEGSFGAALTLHFSLFLTGKKKTALQPAAIAFMYLPGFIFMILFFRWLIITDLHLTPWGWDYIYDLNSCWLVTGVAYCMLCLGTGSFLIFRWYYTAEREIEKNQARPIALSFAAGAAGFLFFLLYAISDDTFFFTFISDTAFVFLFTLFILGVRISAGRYMLMSLHPMIPLVSVMMGMKEACFLVSREGDIICLNREGAGLMEKSRGQNIFEIFSCREIISEEMDRLSEGSPENPNLRCFSADSSARSKSYSINLQSVSDEKGFLLGYVVTAREDLSLADFRSRFGITGRQAEVILLALSGLSNREMASNLGIAERTVENHLFNIYNKLGVDNKIELTKIAGRYGILSN